MLQKLLQNMTTAFMRSQVKILQIENFTIKKGVKDCSMRRSWEQGQHTTCPFIFVFVCFDSTNESISIQIQLPLSQIEQDVMYNLTIIGIYHIATSERKRLPAKLFSLFTLNEVLKSNHFDRIGLQTLYCFSSCYSSVNRCDNRNLVIQSHSSQS